MIAVICLDLVLQTAETVDAMARAAKLATRTNAVIKLARAFRFAMDEAVCCSWARASSTP